MWLIDRIKSDRKDRTWEAHDRKPKETTCGNPLEDFIRWLDGVGKIKSAMPEAKALGEGIVREMWNQRVRNARWAAEELVTWMDKNGYEIRKRDV